MLYVLGRIDISQGVTSLGESTFGRNDRTEFLRAQLCYLLPLTILFALNSQGTDDRKQFKNIKKLKNLEHIFYQEINRYAYPLVCLVIVNVVKKKSECQVMEGPVNHID